MLFDSRIHPASLSDQDLETLQIFGVRAVLAVADATAHPPTPQGLFAHFDELLGTQLPRLERAGLKAWAALGVPAQVLPRRGLSQILDALPGYFRGGKVVAVGQLTLSRGDALEEEALLEQLAVAAQFHTAAIVSTPARDKERLTRRILNTLQNSPLPPGRILVDGATARTVRAIRELGYVAGLTLHQEHLSVEKAVPLVRALGAERLVLNTGAGDGASDILALGRAAHRLARGGLSARVIRKVCHENAAALLRRFPQD